MAAKMNIKVSVVIRNTLRQRPFSFRGKPDNMQALQSKSLENRSEWLQWRKEQPKHTVFGSNFPVWFGLGYQSLQHLMSTLHGRIEEKEIDPFTQRAMDHGTKYEERAFLWFMKTYYELVDPKKNSISITHFRDLPSTLLQAKHDANVLLMMTPDALLLEDYLDEDDEEQLCMSVVEIKCPIRMAPRFDSLEEWLADFEEKNPRGYSSAFLQAALYAASDPHAKEFFTVFYFRHDATNREGLLVYGFSMDDELRSFCLTELCEFSAELLRAPESIRVPSARKKMALDWQEKTMNINWSAKSEFITYSSDKQDSSETGNQ